MAIKLAERMAELKASEIREILKLTQQPGMISFAGGLPAAEHFPVLELKAISEEVLEADGPQALQYSPTEGFMPLREAIAARMNSKLGTHVTADEILIICGSQQGLDLTGKILLDEGDTVLCESPTYLGAIHALKAYQPRFVEVPTDDDGMIGSELERCLAESNRAKLIYLNPNFQNPTGRTWSVERRRQLMEIVGRYRVAVIEDNPYGELRYEGSSLPSLKTFGEPDLVVYLGTFSKIFCPGLRIGWLAAGKSLFEKYVLVKQGTDLHTSTFSQRQVWMYLQNHDLDANIRRLCETYRIRRDTMLSAMDEEFPGRLRYTRPEGGFFVWVELPEEYNSRDLLIKSLEKKVAFVPGGSFFPNGGHENTFRLNYSTMPPELIIEGIRRLGRVLRKFIAMDPPRHDAESESEVA
ncbi:MAG: aminotransferase class I/II-fold pyridoxal phosphate-dependent enzyme [Candidatus Latescibacteria bacterium]|nr:aminotransferase class I/II-fold pyridoxal phosphate-dependent enzyme [Candidatus Latescibacterota bacterium]NIM66537.1 aminotransferase class I/II-fold pyridoxal phosphate-dependent enzyme [Candidatus Latescibacterota bacterium]NIO03018.1 aminotransferase class I/II-fold pyridoxal phosphate-dependent enzyme [Candidatus Latescibacterota bacterium]NIO30154.1 aminotransferase class I/II-fold pyridoxal phosphate-dependent enzyme [Candidatus Latescibacterota bacterium]NIO57771.1 aminotransferase